MRKSGKWRFVLAASLALSLMASAQTARKAESAGPLPASFAGWQRDADKVSHDPAVADPANPGVLKENGFADFEQTTYTREGRKIEVKAARFADAGGAYAAFTFYRRPDMLTQALGDQGASQGRDILFYRGTVLIFARLDTVTAMSAAE